MRNSRETGEEKTLRRVYLAARYSRHPEMRGVRDVLLGMFGIEVTSRWIDVYGGKYRSSFTGETLNADPAYCGELAQHDLEDVRDADTVISFTDADGGGKGGRHVEFGYAIACGKRLIVVGPRENVFHTLDLVEHYPDWSRFVIALSGRRHDLWDDDGFQSRRAEVSPDVVDLDAASRSGQVGTTP